MKLLTNISNALLDIFYPHFCTCCNTSLLKGENVLCLNCLLQLPKTNFNAQADNPVTEKFIGYSHIVNGAALASFVKDGMMQKLLHQFKYQGNQSIGIFLSNLFANELKNLIWIEDVDIIIPVPLHFKKEQKRGFNQSNIIAKTIGEQLGLNVCNDCIIRNKNTTSQTAMTRTKRIQNVENVFEVKRPELLRNKNVLLIDDIITTGATLQSCANTILQYANLISIATIGIATD